jgi:RNA polymerase primary sigma factor
MPDPSERNKLVLSCWPMAKATTRQWKFRRQRVVDNEDASQEAVLHLCHAADVFDPSRGLKFSTLAHYAIRGGVSRARKQIQRHSHARLVLDVAGDDDAPPLDEVDEVDEAADLARLHAALATLRPRHRLVMVLRFGIGGQRPPMTLEKIGVELGVTRERIRQIEAVALERLRVLLAR